MYLVRPQLRGCLFIYFVAIFSLSPSLYDYRNQGSPGPESGPILKSGTRIGTQIQTFWGLGLGPGRKFEKSEIGDWDRDSDLRAVPGTKEF